MAAKVIDTGTGVTNEQELPAHPLHEEHSKRPAQGRPVAPERICFRSTVMPMISPNIQSEMYRVIVVSGKHQDKTGKDGSCCELSRRSHDSATGFVIEEPFGKNSIIELDDGKKITVSNVHIRTVSTRQSSESTDAALSYNSSPVAHRPEFDPENLMKKALEEELSALSKLERKLSKKRKS